MNGQNVRAWLDPRNLLLLAMCSGTLVARAAPGEDRWWPVQKPPKAIVQVATPPASPSSHLALQMMVQSVAGLAARAVNEGRGDELVWVDTGNRDVEDWFDRLLAAHPGLQKSGAFGPWELVDRYSKQGIIKGYILYRLDRSQGEINAYRAGMDCSVNVATSLAGLLEGIIVAEELQAEAQAHGLNLLLDARDKTQLWCFQTYKDRFTRRMLCTQDPRKPHVRDLAIAHRAFTVYGDGEPTPAAMEWLEPLSPILGWNGGDEFATTDLSTRYGHIQTATDWCINLPVLMAGAENLDLPRLRSLDPSTIDWNDHRSGVSFIGTDGDNVQWFEGNSRFQYSPYEAGMGKTFWVKDRNGVEVPVITARYSIWEHQNGRPRSGTPAKVAREIRQTVETTPQERLPRYDWVITHAWSYFKRAPGADENAEDMPQDNAAGQGGVRGYSPVTWCGDRLQPGIRVISPEEMVWRIRMQHDPLQTKRLAR